MYVTEASEVDTDHIQIQWTMSLFCLLVLIRLH